MAIAAKDLGGQSEITLPVRIEFLIKLTCKPAKFVTHVRNFIYRMLLRQDLLRLNPGSRIFRCRRRSFLYTRILSNMRRYLLAGNRDNDQSFRSCLAIVTGVGPLIDVDDRAIK